MAKNVLIRNFPGTVLREGVALSVSELALCLAVAVVWRERHLSWSWSSEMESFRLSPTQGITITNEDSNQATNQTPERWMGCFLDRCLGTSGADVPDRTLLWCVLMLDEGLKMARAYCVIHSPASSQGNFSLLFFLLVCYEPTFSAHHWQSFADTEWTEMFISNTVTWKDKNNRNISLWKSLGLPAGAEGAGFILLYQINCNIWT